MVSRAFVINVGMKYECAGCGVRLDSIEYAIEHLETHNTTNPIQAL